MRVCSFKNIFEYLQASPADYEKAVVAAKEAWETWAEVTGIQLMLIVCSENENDIFMCVVYIYCKSILLKLVIGNCATERRNPETNGGGFKAKENTTGKVGKFALSVYVYSKCKNDKIKLLS